MAKDLGRCSAAVKVLLELLPPQPPPARLPPGAEALWELPPCPGAPPRPLEEPAEEAAVEAEPPLLLAGAPAKLPVQQAAAAPSLAEAGAAPARPGSSASWAADASALQYQPLPSPSSSPAGAWGRGAGAGGAASAHETSPGLGRLSPEASQPYSQQLRRPLLAHGHGWDGGGASRSPSPLAAGSPGSAARGGRVKAVVEHVAAPSSAASSPVATTLPPAPAQHAASPAATGLEAPGAGAVAGVGRAGADDGGGRWLEQQHQQQVQQQQQQEQEQQQADVDDGIDVRFCVDRALNLELPDVPEGERVAGGSALILVNTALPAKAVDCWAGHNSPGIGLWH